MAQLVAKRYARALFEIAVERQDTEAADQIETTVAALVAAFIEMPEFQKILKNPEVLKHEKQSMLDTMFKDKVDDAVLGLLQLVLVKNREDDLLDILKAFLEMMKEHKGIVTASVVSAVPLTTAQKEKIKNQLAVGLGKKIELEANIDATLIGGLKIKAGGYLFDNTVKTELEAIKSKLLQVQLA